MLFVWLVSSQTYSHASQKATQRPREAVHNAKIKEILSHTLHPDLTEDKARTTIDLEPTCDNTVTRKLQFNTRQSANCFHNSKQTHISL